jgi:hypothetical protein
MSSELDAFTALELLTDSFPGESWGVKAGEMYSPSRAKAGEYSARIREAHAQHPLETEQQLSKPPKPTFEHRWAALEAHAAEIASKTWPLMKATASLADRANELEVSRLTVRQLEQLLEDALRKQRPTAAPVAPGGVFTIQRTPWAVDGVFRHGLNLLVGQAGSGKSRLMAAAIAAWLRADQTWLGREMPCTLAAEQRHSLIVGSDQPLEDWAITLEPVGLVERVDETTVRTHPRITLHPLEAGTLLDADGLAYIRRWCDEHPGGAVLVDSMAACLPPGIDEDKSAAAKPVHALQEALGTCWGVLTHHSRKGAGKEGNLGVGAGRGSSAIDGAVSRVIGLGLIHRMENGMLVPQESDPRRELLSTKRGGATLHLVIRSDATGFWSNEGSAEDLKRQERRERTVANLTDAQSSVVAVLEDATGWLTGRQVAEALLSPGDEYDARGTLAATTRKTLKRLEVLGLIETQRVGLERIYRLALAHTGSNAAAQGISGFPQADSALSRGDEFLVCGSNGSNAAAQGISLARGLAHTGSEWLGVRPDQPEQGEPPAAPAPLRPVAGKREPVRAKGEPPCEPPKPLALQSSSHSSQSVAHTTETSGSHPAEQCSIPLMDATSPPAAA